MGQRLAWFIGLSAVVIIVFRSELCLLLGLMLMMSLLSRKLGLVQLFLLAIPAGLLSLGGRCLETHRDDTLLLNCCHVILL